MAIRLDLSKARIYRQPAQLFTCAVHSNTLRSEKFFVATAEQLANIPMRESAKMSSTATSFEDLLSPGTLQRLQEYRRLVVLGQESYFELNQNASYTGGPKPQEGCLLRTSIWWSHLLNRPLDLRSPSDFTYLYIHTSI